jgi:hypothetical protein
MITSIPQSDIVALVCHQLNSMFFVNDADEELIKTKWGG